MLHIFYKKVTIELNCEICNLLIDLINFISYDKDSR